MSKQRSKVLDAAAVVANEAYAALVQEPHADARGPNVADFTADIDALDAQGIAKAPSSFAAAAFALGCLIARELRLLRAGVKP